MLRVIEKQEEREAGEEVLLLDEIARRRAADADDGTQVGGRWLCRAPSRRARRTWARPGGA